MDSRVHPNELQIVFIYDRLSCQKEEDDPKDAILYFHPKEIAEEKRIAICGQLMGITHFLQDMFSSPKILTLENGKFALRNFGRQYVMALGCSSITPDWLLEKQADILESLTRFFHCDIKSILKSCNLDRELLSTKLTSMMDHYIPISQQHGDLFALTFGILPILYLPKSANNISLQASVILQTCMMKTGVLGGIVMYQNKVVGVELGQNLAQKLAFIQPYRMPPADTVKVKFKLPIGVQIFTVYVTQTEWADLVEGGRKFQRPTSRSSAGADRSTSKDSSKINSIREEELETGSQKCHTQSSALHSQAHSAEESVNAIGSSPSTDQNNDQSPKLTNGFVRPKPRRCQSVIELRHSVTDFEDIISCQKFGKSLADPTFPYMRSDGQSLSHSIVNTSLEGLTNGIGSFHVSESEGKAEGSPDLVCPNVSPPLESTPKLVQNSKPPAGLRRPVDLPLLGPNNAKPSERVKKKLWSTFEDIISPIEPQPLPFPSDSGIAERLQYSQSSRMNGSRDVTTSFNSSHLLTSFRKLSSHDNSLYSESGSASSSERVVFTGSGTGGPALASPPPPISLQKIGKLRRERRRVESKEEQSVQGALYIYYDGSMRLLLIVDPEYAAEEGLINSLWEYISSSVIQLKTAVSNVEEQSVFSNQSDPYCFLRYESVWKSLAHGGRGESMDFNAVQLMHRDFTTFPQISELIIRGDDHVVYGYQCVGSEVYYQQRAGLQPGLPMPSDLMGKVPLKAKRRLERDHSIILL